MAARRHFDGSIFNRGLFNPNRLCCRRRIAIFFTGDTSNTQSSFGLQGIKEWTPTGWFIVTGTSGSNGVVYLGPINHGYSQVPSQQSGGTTTLIPPSQLQSCVSAGGSGSGQGNCTSSTMGGWFVMNYPGYGTSIYGPDVVNTSTASVNLVGSIVQTAGTLPTLGFYYSGPITNNPDPSNFVSYQATSKDKGLADYRFMHSVSGGSAQVPLAVGNYGYQTEGGSPWGHAFIYNPANKSQTDIVYPDTDKTHTAYGIWYNGDGTYTIAGGVGAPNEAKSEYVYGKPLPAGLGYLMDYNPNGTTLKTRFYNYTPYKYTPLSSDRIPGKVVTIITHFEGIWSDGKGGYRLPATVMYLTVDKNGVSKNISKAKVMTVKRLSNGHFVRSGVWTDDVVPGGQEVTNDSISGDTCIGVVNYPKVTDSQGNTISNSITTSYAQTPIKSQ
jgi:hypothetical protein